MSQEGFDFCRPHLFGVTFAMKQNVSANPGDVGLLCSVGVMLEPNDIPNLIEEFTGLGGMIHGNYALFSLITSSDVLG